MSDVLTIEKREETGTLRMRRLRKSGKTPGILYGHGEDTLSIAVLTKELDAAIRQGNYIIEIGGLAKGSALIKDLQWDAFGSTVMHLDLLRVDATEAVDVTIQIELRGSAPGTKMGGTVKHLLQEIDMKCPANAVPDKLELSINELELDQTLTVADLDLPAGSEVADKTIAVATCVVEEAAPEEDEEIGGTAEPEVIGRKAEDEEGGGE